MSEYKESFPRLKLQYIPVKQLQRTRCFTGFQLGLKLRI